MGCLYLTYVFFEGTLDASGLARTMIYVCLIQNSILLLSNLKFLEIDKLYFVVQMSAILTITLIVVFFVNYLNLFVLFDVFLCLLIGLALNFAFGDYLGIKDFYKSLRN
tara:strand:+ start:99 stop:425 length:327 start_codon:yes stop_codon:yes gene_type:complete